MQEWKLRQQTFHRLHGDQIEDWLEDKNYKVVEFTDADLAKEVIRHFSEKVQDLIYPAKSYMVAIVYARGLSEHFQENLYTSLSDPDLLAGLDPWFQPYPAKKEVYDIVLAWLNKQNSDLPMPWQVQETQRYFRQEFMLEGQP